MLLSVLTKSENRNRIIVITSIVNIARIMYFQANQSGAIGINLSVFVHNLKSFLENTRNELGHLFQTIISSI